MLDRYYDINYQLKKNGLVKNGPNLKNRTCGSKLGPSPNCNLCLGILVARIREGFIRKKKVVNFHNFGPDPPSPLKVVKTPIFFFYSMTQKTLYAN